MLGTPFLKRMPSGCVHIELSVDNSDVGAHLEGLQNHDTSPHFLF